MKSWIGAVLAWMMILAATAVLVVTVVVPRIAGATPYTVTTGSMQPSLPPGAVVVVKATPYGAIGIGDVITYQLTSGQPAVATHRVVATGINGRGERVLQTQGDANRQPDADLVREVQVKGQVWYSVPYLGRLNTLLTNSQRQWAVYGVAGLLLVYALTMWTSAVRDRTRHGKDEANDNIGRTTSARR